MRFSIAALVLLVAVSGAWAQGQIKYPVFDESKNDVQNVVFKDATQHSDYQHGKLLRITLKSDAKVQGVLVRTDPSRNRIYVRAQPGSPPRAIAVSDIERIEKGVIKQTADGGDVTTPEIQQLVIYNGRTRHVTYQATTLSRGEISALADFESAENELAKVEYFAGLEKRVLENDIAIQTEQRTSRELANQLVEQRITYNVNRPDIYGPPILTDGRGSVVSLETVPELLFGQVSPLPFARCGTSVSPKVPIAAESLAQARRNYLTAQSHAVFEHGRLVAVIVNESAEKTSAGGQ